VCELTSTEIEQLRQKDDEDYQPALEREDKEIDEDDVVEEGAAWRDLGAILAGREVLEKNDFRHALPFENLDANLKIEGRKRRISGTASLAVDPISLESQGPPDRQRVHGAYNLRSVHQCGIFSSTAKI